MFIVTHLKKANDGAAGGIFSKDFYFLMAAKCVITPYVRGTTTSLQLNDFVMT